jgi:hypothetical protein
MKKNIFMVTLVISAMFLLTLCNPQSPAEEEPSQVEIVDEEISSEIIDELIKVTPITLVDKVKQGNHTITYTFQLPENVNVIFIRGIVAVVFSKLGYDIDAIWQIDEDGKHFTDFIYKQVKLILTIDPQTNIFCFEITKH